MAERNPHPAPDPLLTVGGEVTVVLVKSGGRRVRYPAAVERDDGTHVVVRAPWSGPPTRDFGFVRFERGDVFTEHYWRDRWFSVKEVRDADGRPKGWYCDVTRPAAVEAGTGEGDRLVVEDLELDLWVTPDRSTVLRLDEDEFAASGLADRDPPAADRARRALDELERLARADGFAGLTGRDLLD